ncbi:NADP-dependent oxidoreductase [Sphingomonas koreensis]|nr:NADP-dependent oxidoreductase [Sphingomonas koreensis]
MKIVAEGHGSPAAMLRTVPSEDRSPAIGEVAIDVRAVGVNPKDIKLYATNDYARARDRPTAFPLDLGLEASGVVSAIGRDANGPLGPIQVGDEVIAYRIEGAYATRIVVPASSIVPKPARLSWAEAASIMLPATTAAHCLAAVLTRPGDTVLVHAAAGAVGSFVTQLAIIAGATVVGTASAKDFDRLRGYGAIPVPYGVGLEKHVRRAAPRIDAAIDTAGTDEAADTSLALVADRHRIATIVNLQRARQDGFQALGGEVGHAEGIKVRENARYVVAALAQTGALRVQVDRCLPLLEAAAAHDLMLRGGAGRIVLVS